MEEFRKNNLLVTIDCDYNVQEKNCNKEDIKKLENLIKQLDKCFTRDNQNFAEMCYVVYNMKELFNNFAYKRIYAKGKVSSFSSLTIRRYSSSKPGLRIFSVDLLVSRKDIILFRLPRSSSLSSHA